MSELVQDDRTGSRGRFSTAADPRAEKAAGERPDTVIVRPGLITGLPGDFTTGLRSGVRASDPMHMSR